MVSNNERRALARELKWSGDLVYYKTMASKSDSVALADCIEDAQLGWDLAGAAKEKNIELQAELKAARRITVGGWLFRIGLVALAVKGGIELQEELR